MSSVDTGKKECLKVQMLGDFVMTYQGKIIQTGRNQTGKALQLLQLLLYAGPKGLTRMQLMERLYDRGMEGDRANNLRVAVFHLRRLLEKTELPREPYIRAEKGCYRFASSFPVEIDALRFEFLLGQAEQEGDPKRKFELLKEACYTYKGYFLPALSGEEWVVIAGAHFQNLYVTALDELCKQMKQREEYAELLELCSQAAALYPFDEWQICQMECLLELGRPKEAAALYEKTTEMYFNELNMPPSKRMTECFRKVSSQIQLNTGTLYEIQRMLRESTRLNGAYCCAFPSFADVYRVIARTMERFGWSVYLVLCTISDKRQKHRKESESLKEISESLAEAIQETLRRGDTFTCCNVNQYLVLLTGTTREECQIAISRMDACFRQKVNSRLVSVNYRAASAADLPVS